MTPDQALNACLSADDNISKKALNEAALVAARSPYNAGSLLSSTKVLRLSKKVRQKLEVSACKNIFMAWHILHHGKEISAQGKIRALKRCLRSRHRTLAICRMYASREERFPPGIGQLIRKKIFNDRELLADVYATPDIFPADVRKKALQMAARDPGAALAALKYIGDSLPKRIFREAVALCLNSTYWAYRLRVEVPKLSFHIRKEAEFLVSGDFFLAYRLRKKVKDLLEPNRLRAELSILSRSASLFDRLTCVHPKARKVRDLMRLGLSFDNAVAAADENDD